MAIDQSLEALSSGMASVKDVVRILAMNVKRVIMFMYVGFDSCTMRRDK